MRGARWGPLETVLRALADLSERGGEVQPGAPLIGDGLPTLCLCAPAVSLSFLRPHRAAPESRFGEVGLFAGWVDSVGLWNGNTSPLRTLLLLGH